MGKFSIGDRAEVLDEAISGVIQKVDGDRVTLITEDGFPMHFTENDLVKIGGDISVTNYEVAQVKKEKAAIKNKNRIFSSYIFKTFGRPTFNNFSFVIQ